MILTGHENHCEFTRLSRSILIMPRKATARMIRLRTRIGSKFGVSAGLRTGGSGAGTTHVLVSGQLPARESSRPEPAKVLETVTAA